MLGIVLLAVVTVTPRESPQAVLHNPDMGWVLYENYPVDQRKDGSSTLLTLPDEKFDGVDHVAVMFSWADIETKPDEYDFSKVDYAYDWWKKRGKTIQLRMSTESLLFFDQGKGVPAYVLARLPAQAKQTRRTDGNEYVVVDAREPYYLERLEKFLAAVSRHFDRDRPVTLIDLRGFGLWGEWHSGFRYPSLEAKRIALACIIQRWDAGLPFHFLALSYSFDPDSPPELHDGPTDHFDPAFTAKYDDFLRYSGFDLAMNKPNITLRRDGVGGAVHSNERRLNEEAFATLKKGPMSCEFIQFYSQAKAGGDKWVNHLIDEALSLHPNYINLLGYAGSDALAFVREQPELFARGLREMGYRLLPTQVVYPETIHDGQKFTIEMTWINQGVGRAMRDYHLVIQVGDARIDTGAIATSKWIKGQSYNVSERVLAKGIPPGKHTLRVGLMDRERAIALPLQDGDGETYPIGEITCER